MSKYWIAVSVIAFLSLFALAIWLLMRRKHGWSHSIIVHLVFTVTLFAQILTMKQVAYMLLADHKVILITTKMVDTVSAALMALIAMQQLFQIINRLTRLSANQTNDPTTSRIIGRVLKLVIVLVVVLLFGEHFGIGLSGLLTFGGVGGLAIGVAGKDILSNLFSGVMLYFDRPFKIGDWISSPDKKIEGTVVEIGWRITEIKTFNNRPLYVPNSLFSTISVENSGRMTNRHINTTIALRYEDADKIAGIVDEIRMILVNNEQIDQKQNISVYFNAFTDKSLQLMVRAFTKTTVGAEWLAIQQEVYLKIIDIVHAHGADFAYISETVYSAADSHAAMLPPLTN